MRDEYDVENTRETNQLDEVLYNRNDLAMVGRSCCIILQRSAIFLAFIRMRRSYFIDGVHDGDFCTNVVEPSELHRLHRHIAHDTSVLGRHRTEDLVIDKGKLWGLGGRYVRPVSF